MWSKRLQSGREFREGKTRPVPFLEFAGLTSPKPLFWLIDAGRASVYDSSEREYMMEECPMGAEDVKPTSDQGESPRVPVSHASNREVENTSAEITTSRYPLRGKPVRFIDPTRPVAENEWEAAG